MISAPVQNPRHLIVGLGFRGYGLGLRVKVLAFEV